MCLCFQTISNYHILSTHASTLRCVATTYIAYQKQGYVFISMRQIDRKKEIRLCCRPIIYLEILKRKILNWIKEASKFSIFTCAMANAERKFLQWNMFYYTFCFWVYKTTNSLNNNFFSAKQKIYFYDWCWSYGYVRAAAKYLSNIMFFCETQEMGRTDNEQMWNEEKEEEEAHS